MNIPNKTRKNLHEIFGINNTQRINSFQTYARTITETLPALKRIIVKNDPSGVGCHVYCLKNYLLNPGLTKPAEFASLLEGKNGQKNTNNNLILEQKLNDRLQELIDGSTK